jgi:hypothetical protein
MVCMVRDAIEIIHGFRFGDRIGFGCRGQKCSVPDQLRPPRRTERRLVTVGHSYHHEVTSRSRAVRGPSLPLAWRRIQATQSLARTKRAAPASPTR